MARQSQDTGYWPGGAFRRYLNDFLLWDYPDSGFTAVSLILGSLLLVAAALKGHQALFGNPVDVISQTLPWLNYILILVDLLLGFWLLSGLWRSFLWLVTLFVFGGFASYSLLVALQGSKSCGCFGAASVNPWITFTIDLGAILALLLCRRALSVRLMLGSFASAFVLGLVMAATVLNFQGGVDASELAAGNWVGRELPILDGIDIGNELNVGNWSVVIFHRDCPDCREFLQILEKRFREAPCNSSNIKLALVEVDPNASPDLPFFKLPYIFGRLRPSHNWTGELPVHFSMENGVVRSDSLLD